MSNPLQGRNGMPFFGITLREIKPGPGPIDLPFLDLTPETQEEANMVCPDVMILAQEDVPMIHYMPAKYFLKLLRTSLLHTTLVSEQDKDLNDGTYPSAIQRPAEGINKRYYDGFPTKRDVEMLLRENDIARQLTYIHCWFNSDSEDRVMWRDFADSGRGVALFTSSRALFAALRRSEAEYHVSMERVRYVDDDTQLVEFIPWLPMFRKDPRFSHEREIRLKAELKLPDEGMILESVPKHRTFHVNLASCIQAIIFGPLMCADVCQRLTERIKRSLPEVGIQRSAFTGHWLNPGRRLFW